MKNPFGRKHFQEQRKLYTLDHPKASISEAFRMLRTNLMFTNVDRNVKVLLFTSSGPQEGKSVIVANLGVALAQTGKKVLIADCDLRKPVQHEIFGLNKEIGVTKFLTGYCSWEDALQSTQLDNLWLLASGPVPPNPAELLGSKSMDRMMELVCDSFDYVMIDSPPVGAVVDPVILSRKADGVIVVARSGYTKMGALKETYNLLKKAEAHILGTVLNDSNLNAHYYYKRYGRYYRHYYSNYYEE